MIIAIVAYNANYAIGNVSGEIPWKIPEEMRHFKETTMGSPVIVGRKTWDSIPQRFRPLPGRTNIVVTHNPGALTLAGVVKFIPAFKVIEGPFYVADLETGITLAKSFLNDKIFIIGGAQIYKEALSKGWVDRIIASEVEGYDEIDALTYFPLPANWERKTLKEYEEFLVVEYKKP